MHQKARIKGGNRTDACAYILEHQRNVRIIFGVKFALLYSLSSQLRAKSVPKNVVKLSLKNPFLYPALNQMNPVYIFTSCFFFKNETMSLVQVSDVHACYMLGPSHPP